jgi:acyl-CoA thioesterase I
MRRALTGAILFLLVGLTAALAADPPTCPPARLPPAHLPQSRAALAAGRQWVIVALGSSSTAGAAASSPAASYPAALQRILLTALPRASIAIVNRGRNGEDARRELARLDRDVIAVHPSLVIWQVGANAAIRGTPPPLFERLVMQGVGKLHAAGADVILMDNQRSPRVLASALDNPIDQALATAAAQGRADLFSRAGLMDTWQHEGFPYADFIAADRLHQNDRGYACIARALGKVILEGLSPLATAAR